MIVARKRDDFLRGYRLSAAFNVSQVDRVPLDLFCEALGCGTFRRAGNGGWYLEVNRLSDLRLAVVPFFVRFPLVGAKAEDFEPWRHAIALLSRPRALSDQEFRTVLALRERMNRGGKRRHRMDGILRDYTPNSEPGQVRG
jgi:LAGLIDADG endonuclease